MLFYMCVYLYMPEKEKQQMKNIIGILSRQKFPTLEKMKKKIESKAAK